MRPIDTPSPRLIPAGVDRNPTEADGQLPARWSIGVDHRRVAAHVALHNSKEEGASHRLSVADFALGARSETHFLHPRRGASAGDEEMLSVDRTGRPRSEAHMGISARTFADCIRPVRPGGGKPPPRTVALKESDFYVLRVRFSTAIIGVVDDREDGTDPFPAPQGGRYFVARSEVARERREAVIEHSCNVPLLTVHHRYILSVIIQPRAGRPER
jgi:hypothetical protein